MIWVLPQKVLIEESVKMIKEIPNELFKNRKAIALTCAPETPLYLAHKTGLSGSGIQSYEDWNSFEKKHGVFSRLFQGSPLEKLVEDVKRQIPLEFGRIRLMRLCEKECYSLHKDPNPRVHIPLITNDECLFFMEGKHVFHLPADGSIFLMDGRKVHTAINGSSNEQRFHIVISLVADENSQFDEYCQEAEANFDLAPQPRFWS